MADDETPEAPAEAEAPVEAPAEAEAPVEAEAPAVEQEDTFDRKYVEEVRQEAAKYRTRAKPFEEAFDGYDDEDREALLGLVKELRLNPQAGGARLIDAARQILGDEFDTILNDPTPKALTKEDLDKEFKAREERAAQEQAVLDLEKEARELGYENGTADQALLYWFAHNETSGDLKAAHEKIGGARQAVIDQYLAEKGQDGESFPAPISAGSGSTDDQGPAKDLGGARARLLERLAGTAGK